MRRKFKPTITHDWPRKRYTPPDESTTEFSIFDFINPDTGKIFRLQANHILIFKDIAFGKPLIIVENQSRQSLQEFYLMKNKEEKIKIREDIVLYLENNGLIKKNNKYRFILTSYGKAVINSERFKSLLKEMNKRGERVLD